MEAIVVMFGALLELLAELQEIRNSSGQARPRPGSVTVAGAAK